MNKEEILEILKDWNFWNKDIETGIQRKVYLEKILQLLKSELITVITGARRSGKSFIMRQAAKKLIEEGINKSDILIINLEDPRFPNLTAIFLQKIYEVYLENFQPKIKPFIFLDEIQEVENWEKWALMMKELNKANIIITGSNAKLLGSDLATLLTGRHLDMEVFPLSFKEFIKFHGLEIKDKMDIISNAIQIKNLMGEYLQNGSFPEIILRENKKERLLAYFEDILEKDLIKRYKIRKTENLKSLLRFYFSNISSLITFGSLEKNLKISATTIERFSAYFEDAYLLFFIKRFSFKVKEQEKSPRKVYAIDTGLSNAIGFRFIKNDGKLLENAVFLELQRRKSRNNGAEIYYWKNERHHEVDFILKDNEKVIQLIQVCYNINDIKTKEREIRSLIAASAELKCDILFVITLDYESEEIINDKKIIFQPLYKFLLGI